MGANDVFQAAMVYVGKWSPIVFGIAVISYADLIVDFLVKLIRRAPRFDYTSGRRTRR